MNLPPRFLRLAWLPLLAAVFFSPLLTTGLHEDDLVLAVLNYQKPHTVEVMAASVAEWTRGWLESGRFFPVSTTMKVVLFHFFDFTNPLGYHVLQVLAIGLSFWYFIARFVRNEAARPAAALLLCAASAIYGSYHDPYVSYHLLMPVFTLLMLGAMGWFQHHLNTGRTAAGLAALSLYVLALATYEIAYPLVAVFFVQTLATRPRCVRTWACLGALVVAMAAFQAWLRSQASEISYDGISMNLAPWEVARVFAMQTFASLPLAPQVGGIVRRIIDAGGGLLGHLLVPAIILTFGGLAAHAAWRFLRERSSAHTTAVIGWILWLAPALVISISSKYQAELQWGMGYLPRYLGNCGLVLVVAGTLGKHLAGRPALAAAAALALMVAALNIRSVRGLNRDTAAADLLCHVIEERSFLASLGCSRLFVEKPGVHRGEQFEGLNPDVTVHAGPAPENGDHVLLVHPDNPGTEWAAFGRYQDGTVRDPGLILGHRLEPGPAGTSFQPLRRWRIVRLGEKEIRYDSIRSAVSSGVIPAR